MKKLLLFWFYLLTFYEDFKAWRRGERRVAPRGVKGRVYEKKIPVEEISALLATGKFKGTIRPTGIYIAAENRWYDIDENGKRTPREEK